MIGKIYAKRCYLNTCSVLLIYKVLDPLRVRLSKVVRNCCKTIGLFSCRSYSEDIIYYTSASREALDECIQYHLMVEMLRCKKLSNCAGDEKEFSLLRMSRAWLPEKFTSSNFDCHASSSNKNLSQHSNKINLWKSGVTNKDHKTLHLRYYSFSDKCVLFINSLWHNQWIHKPSNHVSRYKHLHVKIHHHQQPHLRNQSHHLIKFSNLKILNIFIHDA